VGYTEAIGSQTEQVMRALFQSDGFLPLHDKSDPDLIYQHLGMSKKAFKKAVGDLFKQRKITIGEDGIRMVQNQQ
jgi:predicted RNA-binding protein (virulence factor B family)